MVKSIRRLFIIPGHTARVHCTTCTDEHFREGGRRRERERPGEGERHTQRNRERERQEEWRERGRETHR